MDREEKAGTVEQEGNTHQPLVPILSDECIYTEGSKEESQAADFQVQEATLPG